VRRGKGTVHAESCRGRENRAWSCRPHQEFRPNGHNEQLSRGELDESQVAADDYNARTAAISVARRG